MVKGKLGSGKRFKALAKKKGKRLAAYIGWKKYGKRMGKMAAAGRRRKR